MNSDSIHQVNYSNQSNLSEKIFPTDIDSQTLFVRVYLFVILFILVVSFVIIMASFLILFLKRTFI